MKQTIIIGLMLFVSAGLFAQNEASKDFLEGTVIARQEGYRFDRFPKLEIGFVGRKAPDTGEPGAYLFMRLQSTMEIGGGVFNAYYNKLGDAPEGSIEEQFTLLMAMACVVSKRADNAGAILDMDIGEIELVDFQWYMTQNQWKRTWDKKLRIKVKMQTVGKEHRLYFYRTSSVSDYRNEFDTFTMPDDVYLTADQCWEIAHAYADRESFYYKAIQIAEDSASRIFR